MTRHTKIVATLGPASSMPEVLDRMVQAGIDVVRMNFSHGTAEDHLARARTVREAAARQRQIVGLLAAASAAGAVSGAASVSNDGYSVAFGSNASVTAATRQEAYEIIRTALGSDPHGLLYRGIL